MREALKTKVMGKMKKLMNQDDWFRLLDLETTEEVMDAVNRREGREGEEKEKILSFDHHLHAKEEKELRSLTYFMNDHEKEYFKIFLLEGELEEIIQYLRLLIKTQRQHQVAFVEGSPYRDSLKLSTDQEIELGDYLRRLENRPYYRVLEPYALREYELGDLMILDTNLKRWYYGTLKKTSQGLRKETQKIIDMMISRRIDLEHIRILTAYLHRKDWDSNAFSALLMDGGKEFPRAEVQKLMEKSEEDLVRQIREGAYSRLLGQEDHVSSSFFIRADRAQYEFYRKLLRKTDNAMIRVLCYTHLLQCEGKDIARILEAKDIGTADELIEQFLIHPLVRREKR